MQGHYGSEDTFCPLPDVEKLLKRTPDGRQTMLFSATMPSAVVSLGRQYMHHPTHIRASDPEDSGATVTAQWATLGHFDFVNIVEAPDEHTMARVSLELSSRGTSRYETLAAIGIDDFIASL